MSVIRVHSSDTQVFVEDVRISGVQSISFETSKQVNEIRTLGNQEVTDRVLAANQTTNFSMDYHVIEGENAFDPFFSFTGTAGFNDLISVDKFNIKVKDNAGENEIEGAYLSSYSLNISVGEIPSVSVSYEADSISYDPDNAITSSHSDSYSVYKPSEISVSTTKTDPPYTPELQTENFAIQNASLSFSIPRTTTTRVGKRVPERRYPTFPINGEISFSVIKNQVTGLDMSSLILSKDKINLTLDKNSGNTILFSIDDCSLISAAESTDLDGNSSIDFNYNFALTNNSLTRSVS
jgi:hypothetical protein